MGTNPSSVSSSVGSRRGSESWVGFEKVVWNVVDNVEAGLSEDNFMQLSRSEEGVPKRYALRMKCVLCDFVMTY